jgi:hypothetical protein
MTIEIPLEDLIHLTETARSNGHSILYMARSTDGKRVALMIAPQARRKRTPKAAPEKTEHAGS